MKQPNRWSCYPAAVSYLTGIPFDQLIQIIGHDGSRIINELPEPFCRDGFTSSEINLALLKLGWTSTFLYADNRDDSRPDLPRLNWPDFEELCNYLYKYTKVLVGIKKPLGLHMTALTPKVWFDPATGEEYDTKYPVISFEVLIKV